MTLISAFSHSKGFSLFFATKLRCFKIFFAPRIGFRPFYSRDESRDVFSVVCCCYAVFIFLALKLVFQACLLLIEWFKLYLAQNNYFAVWLLNYADISLEKGFRPFTANHVFFTHISLTRSFVLLCC